MEKKEELSYDNLTFTEFMTKANDDFSNIECNLHLPIGEWESLTLDNPSWTLDSHRDHIKMFLFNYRIKPSNV